MEALLIVLALLAVLIAYRALKESAPPPVYVPVPTCTHQLLMVNQQPDGTLRIWCSQCMKPWATTGPFVPYSQPSQEVTEMVPGCATCRENGCAGWCGCKSCHQGICDG